MAKEKKWPLKFKHGGTLIGVVEIGMPIYLSNDNIVSAAAVRTNSLYTNGGLGLNLTGSTIPLNKVAFWEEALPLFTHQEFNNRIVNKETIVENDSHATHVAGTIMASGVNQKARGMAYGLQNLMSFSFTNDASEMSNHASSLILSNHSYGTNAGWKYNSSSSRWEFLGRWGANEDHRFGYYDTKAAEFDRIAVNAPYYLIVKSAGNNRSSNDPAVGQKYYRYNQNNIMTDDARSWIKFD